MKEGIKGAATFVRNKGLYSANAVLSRPETISAVGDFISGYAVTGPYEPTRAGALGFGASALVKGAKAVMGFAEGVRENEKK